jgi:fimbrial chaperone protein
MTLKRGIDEAAKRPLGTGLKPLRVLALSAAGLSTLLSAPAFAGALRVDPVKVEITAERKIGAVRVKNDAAQPVTIRGYALSWTQANGEDVHEEVSSIVVSPPVATIPPGGEQLVRVGLRSGAAAAGAYRLVVEEVPEATPGAVQVALRLSMPLFVMQKAGTLQDLSWSARRGADGKMVLEAANAGSGYVRIAAEEATQVTGIAFESQGSLGTVLPHNRRRWVMQKEPVIVDKAKFGRIAR